MQTWTLTSVAHERRSVASATYFNAYDIGMTFGALILGAIPHTFGYTVTFQVASTSMVFFALIYIVSLRREKRTESGK